MYTNSTWMLVPVRVPPIPGLMELPSVSAPLETVPVDEYAPLDPQVRAPERIVVPVPEVPNVGLTVVVLDTASDRQYTAVIVLVTPSLL